MPAFQTSTSSPAGTGYDIGRSGSTPVDGLNPSRSDSGDNFFSVQTTIPVDESREWGPIPTDERNRPAVTSIVIVVRPYATATLVALSPVSTQENSISTPELVGITISAGVVAFTILFAVIWWMRRKNWIGLGNGSRQGFTIEKGEEPPTYEAAVFGTCRDAQPSYPRPTLQSPPSVHHIHSPRPFNAASSSRTLDRFDLDPIIPQSISSEPVDIVVYPHDSPPPPPSPPPSGQRTLSIRSALEMDPDGEGDPISSLFHITDFTEDFPDLTSIDTDTDEGVAVVREIV